MRARDFAFCLQGYFEISQPKEIGANETEMVKKLSGPVAHKLISVKPI